MKNKNSYNTFAEVLSNPDRANKIQKYIVNEKNY